MASPGHVRFSFNPLKSLTALRVLNKNPDAKGNGFLFDVGHTGLLSWSRWEPRLQIKTERCSCTLRFFAPSLLMSELNAGGYKKPDEFSFTGFLFDVGHTGYKPKILKSFKTLFIKRINTIKFWRYSPTGNKYVPLWRTN